MSVRIRGKVYPTAKDAGKALGVSTCTVYSALHHGREDYVGTGTKRPHNGGHNKPLLIGGKTYRNRREASLALGRHFSYVGRLINEGKPNGLRLLAVQFLKLHTEQEQQRKRKIKYG